MNQWFIKHFKKSKMLKVIVFTEDNRGHTYYVVPKDEFITIKELGLSYAIDRNKIVLTGKNVPTLYMNYKRNQPINILDKHSNTSITARELNTAIESKVATEIMHSMKDKKQELIIIAIIVVVALAVFYTLFNQQITNLQNQVDALQKALENLGLAVGGN